MRYSRQARRDILDIWLQIAITRPVSADRAIDRIKSRCRRLIEFPLSGPARPDLLPEARAIAVDRWLAIYRIDARGPQIVRVVDGARDLSVISLSDDEDL